MTAGALTALLFTVASACSNGDDDAADTTLAPTDASTTVPADTEPAPETTVATTTTSTTTTTLAPTTTIDPIEALTAEIEADLNEGEQAFIDGAMDPGSPTTLELAERYNSGESLDIVLDLFSQLEENGWIATRSAEHSSQIVVYEIVEASADIAVVEMCRIDAAVIVQPQGELPEIVINDEVVQYISEASVVFDDGVWKLNGGRQLSRNPGVTTCE